MGNNAFENMLKRAKANDEKQGATEVADKRVVKEPSSSAVSPSSKKIGRPAKAESALRTSWIRARVSDEELMEIKMYCAKNKLSQDEFIRNLVLSEINK